MIDSLLLFTKVLLLLLMLIPGFVLKKTKIVGDSVPKDLSNIVLYVLQPAMLMAAYFRPFDKEILINALWILLFTFISHTAFSLLCLLFFRKAPEDLKRVYRFGSVFSNAGYMGIPLIVALFGQEAAIYASVYVIGFSFFSWSVGCLIYTKDKKYVSLKKIFFNLSTIPTYIGIAAFLLSLTNFIPSVIPDCVSAFGSTVAPISMLVVGMRLADIDLRSSLNKYLPLAILLRLLVFPLIVLGILKIFEFTGLCTNEFVISVTLICSATPSSTMTSMFAEKFGQNSKAAGVLVSLTTFLSVLTMPLLGFIASL